MSVRSGKEDNNTTEHTIGFAAFRVPEHAGGGGGVGYSGAMASYTGRDATVQFSGFKGLGLFNWVGTQLDKTAVTKSRTFFFAPWWHVTRGWWHHCLPAGCKDRVAGFQGVLSVCVLPRGLGHNLLMQFSTLLTAKMEISESEFFLFLTVHNE